VQSVEHTSGQWVEERNLQEESLDPLHLPAIDVVEHRLVVCLAHHRKLTPPPTNNRRGSRLGEVSDPLVLLFLDRKFSK